MPTANGNYGSFTTKISDIAAAAVTPAAFATVAGTSGVDGLVAPAMSFIWSDTSAADAADYSVDWKVPGIPTTTLTLTK